MRGGVQIDVVTPAADYDLIDLPTLQTLLNTTDVTLTPYFDLVIPQASAIVAQYCNQPFVIEAIQTSFWPTRDGWPWVVRNEIAPLQLPRWPLTAVASVVETVNGAQTTLVAGTDYIVDNAKGQISRLDRNGYPRSWALVPIVVVFSAGYAAIPFDVVSAVANIIKGMLAARNRDPMLRSENIEQVYQATYWFGAGPDSSGGLPSSISGPLDKYRMPVVA
jgi:hypothetical protein